MSEFLTPDSAARLVRHGQVVAFPTETFYGLAALPMDHDALLTLAELKGRDAGKPIGLIISDAAVLSELAIDIAPELLDLCEHCWPGPLTVVFPAVELDAIITGGSGTVAVRVPSSEHARELTRLSGGAVTATSANKQGAPPPCTAAAVREAFAAELRLGTLAGISGGWNTPGHLPSTIVTRSDRALRVLRTGAVSIEELRRWWRGPILTDKDAR